MADKVKKYRVSPRMSYKHPQMVTLVPVDLTKRIGPDVPVVSVSLGTEEVRRTLPATRERPATELVSKVATQAQLKYLFEVEKHPFIEEYEE